MPHRQRHYRALVLARAAAAIVALCAVSACSRSPQIEPFGGTIVVQLEDSSPAARQAVEDTCGHLPGVQQVRFLPDQPDTIRFDIPPKSRDKKHLRPAIWACIHRMLQVRRAIEPL